MTTHVTDGVTYLRSPDVHAVEMDGELVMMGLEQGEYFGLRDTAASLWNHLAEPATVERLCELVAAEYEVDAAVCRPDVVAFLQDLLERDLVAPVA